MSIRDKLIRLDKSAQTDNSVSSPGVESWVEEFQRELDARIIQEKNSFLILKENYFPAYHLPYFREARENSFHFQNIHKLSLTDQVQPFNLRQCLFIDLETTGLAGGTGTFAFLFGLGHVELDHIVVRQYLVPDFQHEWLALKHIESNLQAHQYLVSFNGKTYDLPLLRNRFILNRMDSVLEDVPHFDILHMARRIWKRRLQACDLQNLEVTILGQERSHDIPGVLIPQLYFEYIRKRDASLLRDVLEHNFHDIVNLVLLFILLENIVRSPLENLEFPEDILSLARFYFRKQEYDATASLLNYLLENHPGSHLEVESLFLQSMVHKKQGKLRESSRLIQELLSRRQDHPEAIEELAKYFEHKEKDLEAARECVLHGIQHIELMQQLGRPTPLLKIKDSLMYRLRRLERKIGQQS
ncbi:MAG: metal-dependent exonucleaseMrfB [Calditrichia bacterium]